MRLVGRPPVAAPFESERFSNRADFCPERSAGIPVRERLVRGRHHIECESVLVVRVSRLGLCHHRTGSGAPLIVDPLLFREGPGSLRDFAGNPGFRAAFKKGLGERLKSGLERAKTAQCVLTQNHRLAPLPERILTGFED